MSRNHRSGARSLNVLFSGSIAFALIYLSVLTCDAAGVKRDFVFDFSGYRGGSVDDWLRAKHFTFEKDAKNRRLLQLSVADDTLTLEAKGRLSGFLLNDAVNVENITRISMNWGIIQYPCRRFLRAQDQQRGSDGLRLLRHRKAIQRPRVNS